MATNRRAAWTYSLKRDELIACLTEFETDWTGMHSRWAQLLGDKVKARILFRLLEPQ